MSWFEAHEVTCTACGTPFEAHTADSLNAARHPKAREQILAGTFHRVACPGCASVMQIDRCFLYTDVPREHFVHVFPADHLAGFRQWEAVAEETFTRAFGTAPPVMREIAQHMKVRAVFGIPALADKLRVWDAGLDDALVEIMKSELLLSFPALRERPDVSVDVVAVAAPEQIEVVARSPATKEQPERFAMTLARYRELAAARAELTADFPELFSRPFVGFRRLF